MSLYLKLLDDGFDKGEKDLFFVKGHVLPDMTDNIQCGNSLIGWDYFDGRLVMDDEEIRTIKPFDWHKQFPNVFTAGGFDCVIGNPPYIRSESLGYLKTYFNKKYSVYDKAADIFFYFFEKGFQILKNQGLYGVISNNFNKTTGGKVLRSYLREKTKINYIIDFSRVQIFKGAITYPVIFVAENEHPENNYFSYNLVLNEKDFAEGSCSMKYVTLSQKDLEVDKWSFNVNFTKIFDKINNYKSIREIFGKSYRGLITGLNEAFILENPSFPLSQHIKPIFEGKDITKWITTDINKKLIIFQSGFTKTQFSGNSEKVLFKKMEAQFPDLFKILKPFEEQAKKRYDQGEYWWELRSCAYYNLFEKPKIIFPNLQKSNKFAFDDKGTFINAPAVFLPVKDKWLLSILNSKLVWFFLMQICVVRNGGYIEVKPQYFEQIPIPELENKTKEKLTSFVDEIQQTYKDFRSAKRDADKKRFEQKIALLDSKIDELVYQLYGLTEEEIRLVESG
ncbi:MAG: hypothetical protein EHM72_04775 [Calditrichaeota bacterium]|nr:MAG: hypothetical protein EHM72_04775 [Calditrichota bacterium]